MLGEEIYTLKILKYDRDSAAQNIKFIKFCMRCYLKLLNKNQILERIVP